MRMSLALAAGLVVTAAPAGTELVDYPAYYATGFVRYDVLDKPDRGVTRFFYINAEALEAAKPGAPLPDGTVLVMEDHLVRMAGETPVTDAAGGFIPTDEIKTVFVMEKRAGWGADYAPEVRNGEWEYAWFDADGARSEKTMEACFECHKAQGAEDFTFTVEPFLAGR